MKVIVTNLTNSPLDIEGGLKLPAMGSIDADLSDEYLAALRLSPAVRIRDAERPKPETVARDLTDADLFALVEKKTGKKPHHRTGRAKLLEMLNG